MGERIKQLLAGRSQQWLADQAGMKQPGIQALIKGKVKRPGKLKEIAEALGTSQEYLLGETEDPAAPASEKIPTEVLEAINAIPGALSRPEIDILVGAARLIVQSRTPHNGDSQNNGEPQGN